MERGSVKTLGFDRMLDVGVVLFIVRWAIRFVYGSEAHIRLLTVSCRCVQRESGGLHPGGAGCVSIPHHPRLAFRSESPSWLFDVYFLLNSTPSNAISQQSITIYVSKVL